jgi:hypothetical protein
LFTSSKAEAMDRKYNNLPADNIPELYKDLLARRVSEKTVLKVQLEEHGLEVKKSNFIEELGLFATKKFKQGYFIVELNR